MANCMWCKVKYYAHDDDAGTYKERFHSEECEQEYENELDRHIASQPRQLNDIEVCVFAFGIGK